MSDQAPPATTDEAPSTPLEPPPPADIDPRTRPLSIDAILNSARLVERTARICLRGDLEDAYREKVDELAGLVDEDGVVRGGEEATLADKSRAVQLADEVEKLLEQIREHSYSVRFRAMPSEQWELFYNGHLNANGRLKDTKRFNTELIAACAVEPTLSKADVQTMRERLSHPQMMELANEAFWANTTGGTDIPKSPSFLLSPSTQDTSLS